MKKRIVTCLSVALLSWVVSTQYSCSTDPTTPANVALADGQAGLETYGTLVSTVPIASATPLGQVGAVVASGIAAAVASGLFEYQHPISEPKELNISLPETFLLNNNPYEEAGIVHNKSLELIFKTGDPKIVYEKLKNNDQDTWKAFIELASNNSQQPAVEVLSNCDNGQCLTNYFETTVPKIVDFTNEEQLVSSTYLNSENRSFMLNTYKGYKYLWQSDPSNVEIYGYLNDKISSLLSVKTLTKQQEGMVIGLTILKHSNYYWYGK